MHVKLLLEIVFLPSRLCAPAPDKDTHTFTLEAHTFNYHNRENVLSVTFRGTSQTAYWFLKTLCTVSASGTSFWHLIEYGSVSLVSGTWRCAC